MVGLQKALIGIENDLRELGYSWALVGGLAVSVRAEPRTTRDLDVAVAVDNNREAERLIVSLRDRGYVIDTLLEQEATGRLATVRLLAPGEETGGIVVDLLFASSGAEPEIVASSERIEVLPGLVVPVATLGHLVALKVLAARAKDLADIEALLEQATPEDLDEAKALLGLITDRGCARNQDLLRAFAVLLSKR